MTEYYNNHQAQSDRGNQRGNLATNKQGQQSHKDVGIKKSTKNHAKDKYVRRSIGAKQPEANSNAFRPVFAAYLNMARANLYSVLKYISAQCGLDVNQNEDSMHELAVAKFANNKYPEVRQKVFLLLMRHIPVLQQMTQANLTQGKPAKKGKDAEEKHLTVEQEDAQRILQDMIRVINFQRNRFTHADHYDTEEELLKEEKREKALYRPLETAWKGSKREAKRIFCYTSQDMKFVDQERMKKIKKLDGEGNAVKDKQGREQDIYVECSDWYFRLYDTSEDPITHVPHPEQLTTAGLVFLLCKLLHKRYATQLVQKTGLLRTCDKSGYSPFKRKENEVMFNIFCAHRIRLPRGRMESTAPDSALGLDMLNELQKCPAELFETLSEGDRKLFQVKRKDKEVVPDPDDDINLFRRNGDRFPQLAMRYIDTMRDAEEESCRVLSDIVFQVSLGKFRHTFYNRPSLDKDYLPADEPDRLRVLQKEINGFGPIDKVERKRRDKYKDLIRPVSDDPKHLYDADTVDTAPYLTDHYAAYAITGERIGITWNAVIQNPNGNERRNTIRLKWGDKVTERLDADKCFLPTLPTPTDNIAPRAWLSVHELPNLIFLRFLGGNPEAVIKDTYGKLTCLFYKIVNGKKISENTFNNKEELETLLWDEYKLHLRDLPKKVVDYLLGRGAKDEKELEKEFNQWVNRQLDGDRSENKCGIIKSLENRITKFEQDLKTIGDKQNRIGCKGYVEIRPGTLARYISKDIMAMTRPDTNRKNNGKPSGLDFGVLQSSIATFKAFGEPLSATPLGDMLKKAINIDNHPFLSVVMGQQVKDTIDLYQKYQNAKLNYLKQLRQGKKGNYKDQWFLREAWHNHVAKTPEYMQGAAGLATKYFETMQLPDGLFNSAIREQIGKIDNAELKLELEDEKKKNGVSHLINAYFTHELKDNSQPFYRDMKRHYKFLDWILFKQNPDHIVPILPTLVPTESPLSAEAIAALLRKGDEKEAPVYIARHNIANRLQRKIGSKRILLKDGSEKRVPDYGKEGSATNEEKDALFKKLMHQLRDMQRNERDIRRYRNQDMLLFLMAKKILLSGGVVFKGNAQVENGTEGFMLRNILPPAQKGNGDNMLEQQVAFRLTINLKDENFKSIEDENGNPIQRTIFQDKIKLKNYGDFYTFLHDSRIGSLLSQLPQQDDIERKSLEDELDVYDRKRVKVFSILQDIERQIILQNPAVNNVDGLGFKDSKGIIYRNSFSSLLTLCRQYITEGGELNAVSNLLVGIRNAFSHNYYVKGDKKLDLDISQTNLPEVAKSILQWVEKQNKVDKKK